MLFASVALACLSTTAFAQQRITVGQTVSGALAAGDSTLNSGEFYDTYTIQGRAGQVITVRMNSQAVDSYIMMRGPDGFSEDNDDAPQSARDAELVVRIPTTGIYRIMATSYGAKESGRYTLSVRAGGTPGTSSGNTSSGGGSGNSGDQPIAIGQSITGSLSDNDRRLGSGEAVDYYSFNARRGQSFDLTLQSSAFDSYLLVRGPGGLSEDNDDDQGGRNSRDARVRFTAAEDGPIRIGATSFREGERGSYRLTLRPTGGDYAPPPSTTNNSGSTGTLRIGSQINGRLTTSDTQLSSGEYSDRYTLEGRAGQIVDLQLTASDFDAFVQINGPDGFVQSNDDDYSGNTRNSRLVVRLPSNGRYTVMATSYAARETGSYTLNVRQGNASDITSTNRPQGRTTGRPGTTANNNTSGGGTLLTLGQTRQGTLARGDSQLGGDGEYYDTYRFMGRRGQRIQIDATSSDFDSYLILRPPTGSQIDNDDGPSGRNARISEILTQDGEYSLQVTSYQRGETGRYTLSLQEGREPERVASVPGGQRVFAVMVGVSDYGGRTNNLPNTDEDARKLSESLQRAGVLNPQSVVLTNAQATRAGVRAAFRRVAAQAGPDDVFMFFFSGHGTQENGPTSAIEPDGRGEQIELRDGGLTDTELAEMFGTVRARLSMVVLDSCFSGGFARNIVTRPGVMGVFSSEEDLTSLVASKFEAGGYLSYFLRDGMSGAADANGDSIISAGELSAYLREQFNSPDVGRLEAETTDGQRNYQNLVIDRGGVQVDDVIVRLGGTSRRGAR